MSLGENIRKIRKEKGYSILKLRELTGLSKSTISEIENDKSSPTFETLNKIAKALGIRVETLISYDQLNEWDNKYKNLKEDQEKYTLSEKAEKDIQKSLSETLNLLQESQGGLMFDGEPLDDETRELLAQSLENSMRLAKKIAKEKYTPKKYKK